MMNKTFWNRIINALALMLFCFMISTGLILKFILPPGSGRMEKLFSGAGRAKTVDLLAGLGRHEWGTLHFYFSIAFLVLILVHLILHWNWIRATAWGTKQRPQSGLRKGVTLFIILMILASVSLPWFLNVQTMTASNARNLHPQSIIKEL